MFMSKYDAELITSYAEMKWWRDRFFAENGLRFLIVIGSPGSAKTRMFQDGAPTGTLHQSGSLSAFYLYKQLYVHLDDPVVIDDVDGLFKDKAAINLLKCLCNTDERRVVFWGKRNRELEDEGVPSRFGTTSRVVILANTMAAIEANLAAVLDRAVVLHFQPTVAELHAEVASWFADTEVYEFIGQHLPLIGEPSMRTYVKAAEMKRLGGDWRAWLLRRWTSHDPKLALVAQIMADATLQTAEQRVARFAERGGGSRPTYMRKQAEWRKLVGVPARTVA